MKRGKISEDIINKSVYKILKLKERIGLFDDHFKNIDPEKKRKLHLCKEHGETARIAAEKSFVLLKNEGDVLPLNKDERIAVVGPFMDDRSVIGAWCCHGSENDTVREGMIRKAKKTVVFAKVCNFNSSDEYEFKEARSVCESADKIVVCLGEQASESGESKSRQSLHISPSQT